MSTVTFFTPVQEGILLVEECMRAQGDVNHHPDLRAALDQLISAGGKRVRPTLVLLVGNLLGGPPDKLVTLGAAVEMLHTATLVHDDLIDNSLLRRGMPTLNAKWSSAATVLTGDYLFARAARLAAQIDNIPLMHLFAETLAIIVNGELTQLFAARGLISRKNYYERIYAKTASLFEMSALAAAMVSTDERSVHRSLKTYGYEIGIAFQIMDDVLDFTGEQATVGKPLGSDLLQGLVTLPAIYYVESHPDDPNVQLLSDGQWGDAERMAALVESIRESEAIQLALQQAGNHVDKAREALEQFPPSTEREALDNLARYFIDRRI